MFSFYIFSICPLNTVGNWYNEFKLWLKDCDKNISIHKLYDEKNLDGRIQALKTWKRRGGVGIIHYDCFRSLVGDGKPVGNKKNLSKAAKKLAEKAPIIKECLLDHPDIVVCDEGIQISNLFYNSVNCCVIG